MAASASLAEPQVLAQAKRRLFPEGQERDRYAVVDTQFATDEWLAGETVADTVRETLAPFNHVRVGSGYPDLVGVGQLDRDVLAVERFGSDPPLVVVEAKGHAGDGTVDTQRGLRQAYDRLHEANVAFLAAPTGAVSETDRTLARELNVGVLGVDADGTVDALEVPRVVGNRTSDDAAAIRFQAGAQGVADQSFGLNHPKNYLGYALASYAAGSTGDLLDRYDVVGAVEDARRGAAFLGLVEEAPTGPALTALGHEVVRFALSRYCTAEDALAEFRQWHGSSARFYDDAPEWGQLARRVVHAYPATELLVTELQQMHDDHIPEPSLVDLVVWLHEHHPTFTVELFVRGDQDVRSRVLTGDGDLRDDELADGEVYHSPTVFQLKAMLYHAGILTERGAEPTRLDPTDDVWALREPV
jgi:hypothetical protein